MPRHAGPEEGAAQALIEMEYVMRRVPSDDLQKGPMGGGSSAVLAEISSENSPRPRAIAKRKARCSKSVSGVQGTCPPSATRETS